MISRPQLIKNDLVFIWSKKGRFEKVVYLLYVYLSNRLAESFPGLWMNCVIYVHWKDVHRIDSEAFVALGEFFNWENLDIILHIKFFYGYS